MKTKSESLDVVNVCTTYCKKRKHLEKRKKNNNLKNSKYENEEWISGCRGCLYYIKKRKHLEKRKKNNNLKNSKYENVNWWGPSFYI